MRTPKVRGFTMHGPVKSLWNNLASVEAVIGTTPLGLLTDVDGTISEIAPSPEKAAVAPETRRLLESFCRKVAVVAAVSGRSAQDAQKMVGVEGMVYFGNHGLESRKGKHTRVALKGARKARQDISEALQELRQSLHNVPGLIFENKGLSASIHYRLSPEPETIAKRLLEEAAYYALPRGLESRIGKMVVEIRPRVASKGSVVKRLVRRFRLGGAIYFGDDDTDVEAFQAIHSLVKRKGFLGLTVAVLSTEIHERVLPTADFYLDGVADVVQFLKWLDDRLTEPVTAGPPFDDKASG